MQLDEGAAACSTVLQQLRLRGCSLPADAFPAALCVLSQLTSLQLVHCNVTQLPPAFSNLR